MPNLILTFLKELNPNNPFDIMADKKSVYEDFFNLSRGYGLAPFVSSTKNYKGSGLFLINGENIKADVVYDRSGGISFPPEGDKLRVVDNRAFKLLAWNKWEAYKLLSEFMPFSVQLQNIDKLKSQKIVVKPVAGLKGQGIFIGTKKSFKNFKLNENKNYIAQEFIDTSKGIPGITNGMHDLRVVVINRKIVWSHVRTPAQGSQKANVAAGGTLTEVDTAKLPEQIVKVVSKIADLFYTAYDNPVFSLDFGVDRDGKPFIYEINDQIGFPKPEMKAKDLFLKELVENLLSKV